MGFSNWRDFFTRNGAIVTGDGISTTVTAEGQIRMNVTSIPVSEIKAEGDGNFLKGLENAIKDLAIASERGHLLTSKDFKNVEVAGYIEVLSESGSNDNRGVVWYGPSGRHTGDMQNDDEDIRGCGTTYKRNYNTKKK